MTPLGLAKPRYGLVPSELHSDPVEDTRPSKERVSPSILEPRSPALFTFGYADLRGVDDLRRLLAGTGIDTIVDIRLSQWSSNRAFSTGTRYTVLDAGLAYVHEKGLGNRGYKTGTIEIADIERIEGVLTMLRAGRTIGLMCVEKRPEGCHRWTLVQEALDREPALTIVHL